MSDKNKLTASKSEAFVKSFSMYFLVVVCFVFAANAQDAGRKVFETKCFSCHSIGGGDKQGPDLKGITEKQSKEWISEFIKSPIAMSKKDPVAAELFKKFAPEIMPDQTLSAEELDAVIELIRSLTAKNEIFTPAGAKLARAIKPGDVVGGWRYFTGQTKFANGGVSCSSCHSISSMGSLGGGTLGPDLTAVSIKYKDPELILILQSPNFPTMTEMFRDHKLNDEEIVQLFAYLQDAKQKNPHAPVVATTAAATIEPRFLVAGFAVTIFSLIGLNLIWRKRHKGVREELVRRSRI